MKTAGVVLLVLLYVWMAFFTSRHIAARADGSRAQEDLCWMPGIAWPFYWGYRGLMWSTDWAVLPAEGVEK